MSPSTKPVIVIVDPDGDTSATVELGARYSQDYTIVVESDAVSASQRMRALTETGTDVALILADRASNGASRRQESTPTLRRIYALPLSRYGWSIGNLLTCRRVVDRASGAPLPFKRAVVRYFARGLGALRFRYEVQARGRGSSDGLSTADRIVDSVVIKNIVIPSD